MKRLKAETLRTHREHADMPSELLTDGTNVSIVQVDTAGLKVKFYSDPEYLGGVYTYSHIPASAVSLVGADPRRVAARHIRAARLPTTGSSR